MNIGLQFDMDGVIVNNHTHHYQDWQIMCEKYGKSLSENSYMQNMYGRTLNEVVAFISESELSPEKVCEIGEDQEELTTDLIIDDFTQLNLEQIHELFSTKE